LKECAFFKETLKSCVFRGPQKPRLVFSKALEKLSPLSFPASAVLDVLCTLLFLSLSPKLSSLLPELARVRTGRAATPTLAFPTISFEMKL
jgi:hypothetical protein